MPRPANFFKTLDGVPVHYDRPPLAAYGSTGVEYDFHATQEMERILDRCFAEIWEKCPFGKGNIITSAGAWVDKPLKHGTGEAFDLDGIHWDDKIFVSTSYPSDPRFYLGIEAVLRKHLPTVLDYNYNSAHHDHLHIDLGGTFEFRTSSQSKVFFLQAALTHVLDLPVEIDGDWGTETSGALADALQQLGISGDLTQRAVWLEFLDRVIERAFDISPVTEEEEASDVKEVVVSSATVDGKVQWSAVVDNQPAFYVGTQTSFDGMKGIFNYKGDKYDAANYRDEYGFWADFIYPTAVVESLGGRFICLNTYDKAYFTFGFMQFAAHVYNGDFANYFRALLALPEAAQYFPDLILKDGIIHKQNGAGAVKLEDEDSGTANPSPLMKYLNPTSATIEKKEVEQAARFIHWTMKSAEARDMQVRIGVETFKRILKSYVDTYSLDGMIDKVCLVIADIYHHGRGRPNREQKIKTALDTGGDVNAAYENLLGVGVTAPYIQERVATLRATIKTMVQQGKLAKMKYSKAENDFVPL